MPENISPPRRPNWPPLVAGWVEATQQDQAEFEYLAAEIITTELFSNEELQRFLALWWTGHIRDCVRKHGDLPSPQ